MAIVTSTNQTFRNCINAAIRIGEQITASDCADVLQLHYQGRLRNMNTTTIGNKIKYMLSIVLGEDMAMEHGHLIGGAVGELINNN